MFIEKQGDSPLASKSKHDYQFVQLITTSNIEPLLTSLICDLYENATPMDLPVTTPVCDRQKHRISPFASASQRTITSQLQKG